MKSHITKVVAMLMAVLMLISLVPAAALPDLTLPDLQSVTIDGEAEKDNTSADSSEETPADSSNASENGLLTEEQIAAIEEAQVSAEEYFEEVVSGVVLGKDVVTNDTEYYANNYEDDLITLAPADEDTSPYEPAKTENEDDPFLPGGKAWINLDVIQYGSPATPTVAFSEWSANTTFQNTSGVYYRDDNPDTPQDETLQVEYYVFPDVDLIDENLWGYTRKSGTDLKIDNYSYPGTSDYNTLYNGDNAEGFAYNRYDPMQGKWGVTFDVERTMTSWVVDKYVDPTKTPHLLFSTEQVDGVKMSIAVKIGTPVVDENGVLTYEYRWYTITDDNPHPDVDTDHGQSTIQMLPDVTISAVNGSPIHNETTYIDNALTGCIDMTYWLPFVESTNVANLPEGVDFKTYHIAEVSVSTPEANAQASRINYLYFNCQAAPFMGAQTNTGSNQLLNEGVDDGYANDDQNGWQGSEAAVQTLHNNYHFDIDVTANNTNLQSGDFVTDKNGQKCYALTIPVRKWVNVAKDARVLSYLITTDSAYESWTDEFQAQPKPTISIWGNGEGYIDTSVKNQYGVYQNETCLFVTGGRYGTTSGVENETPYLIGTDGTQKYATTDFDNAYEIYTRNFAHGNTNNHIDWLQSPGMEDGMITEYTENASAENPNMYGWVYVSSVRLVLPFGAIYRFNAGNLGANLASLNLKDGSYDGGTGIEPTVELGTYNTGGAAALGPLLADSDGYSRKRFFPQYGDFYGQVATLSPNAEGVRVHNTIEQASVDYYAGYNTSAAGYEDLTVENGVILLGTVYNDGTPYYYIDYKGKNYWVNGWGTKVTPGSQFGNTDAPLLQAGTGQKNSLGTVTTDSNGYVSGIDTTNAWGYSQWHRSNVDLGIGNWYQCAGSNELPNTEWGVSGNGYNKTDISVEYQTNFSASNDGHTSVSRTPGTPIAMKPGDQLFYDLRLQTVDGGETGGIVLAFTMEIDGIEKNVFIAKDGDKAKLLVPDNTTTTEDCVLRSDESIVASGYIDVSEFLSSIGATSVKVKEVHLQTCRYSTVVMSMHVITPSYSTGKVEMGQDSSGKTVVGESYNVVADTIRYTKVDGGYGTTFYDAGMNTVDAHNANKIIGNADVHGEQGWYLEYASDDYKMASSGKSARLDPALGGLSIGVKGEWEHLLLSHKDGGINVADNPYLYYSFSARSKDLVGAAVDIEGNEHASATLFIVDNTNTSWAYDIYSKTFTQGGSYDYTTHGISDIGGDDGYAPTVTAAFDLTTVPVLRDRKIKSIGLFFHNTTGDVIDYYFNYCYVSSTVPSKGYEETVVEREFVHNYYMMDNNPGRYATRYPVFNNPTGKIYADEDRVNPLKLKRGDYFYEGYFYNGLPLDNFYEVDTNGELRVDANNQYINVYPETNDNLIARLTAVWFYKYEIADLLSNPDDATAVAELEKKLKKILYYYQFDPEDDGVNALTDHTYKAIWGHSRWPDYKGTGLNAQILGYYIDNDNATGLSGTLVNMFVSNNNCLVRSGLETIKYKTTFITGGGQMNYKGSSGIESGVIANTDNRYIYESPLMGYYYWPKDIDSNVVNPVRYGYKFDGWYSIADPGDGENQVVSKDYRIARYHTKEQTGEDIFYAHWTKMDEEANATYGYGDGTPAVDAEGNPITWGNLVNKLTFKKLDGSTLYSREADYGNDFIITIPNTMMLHDENGDRTAISGWAIDVNGDGKYSADVEGAGSMYTVFAAGEKVTVTDNITLVPVPTEDGTDPVRVKITLTGAKLYAKLVGGGYGEIKQDDGRGVTVSNDGAGTYTYLNVPRNLVLRAIPLADGEAGAQTIADGMGWQIGTATHENNIREAWKADSGVLSFVSSNKDYYDFAAYCDMDISYASYSGAVTNRDTYGASITSYTDTRVTDNGQMIAYAQYYLPESYDGHAIKLIQSGTMYTSQSRLDSLMHGRASNMIVTWKADGGIGVANNCALSEVQIVRQETYKATFLPTTETNSMDQYYFMLTNPSSSEMVAYTRPYLAYWIDLDDNGTVSTDEVRITYSNYVMKTWIPAPAA